MATNATKTNDTTQTARAALAGQPIDDDVATRLVQRILNYGLDGFGPISGAADAGREALAQSGSPEEAVNRLMRNHIARGAAGGFLTGLGGFLTMAVALPANVVEFYVQSARMVGAIAHVRGYDIDDPQVRSAILLSLVGSDASEVAAKAGWATGSGRLVSAASKRIPESVLMMINKGVGFRILKNFGGRFASRLGRGVPVVGGFVGAGLDGYMMKRVADQALKDFPVNNPVAAAA